MRFSALRRYIPGAVCLALSLSGFPALAEVVRNDAGRLSPTSVHSVIHVPADRQQAERALAGLVRQAATRGDVISIAGAQHTMGGHTLYPGGLVVDMLPFQHLHYDPATGTLHAGAGALWSDIISYLRPLGKTVAIMQSNSAFSVGGSLSANCHGWQPNRGPIASTVKRLRVLDSSGHIRYTSRTEDPELFRHILGGYGLFGIILEAELEVVDDEVYQRQSWVVPAEAYVQAFEQHAKRPEVGLAYGRLRIDSDGFLNEAILTTFARSAQAPPALSHQPPVQPLDAFKHTLFRNSVQSHGGKRLRWELETRLGQFPGQHWFWRSDLMDQPLHVIENPDTRSSDLLHEYFIPLAQVPAFLKALRQWVPAHEANLLNVTLRNVMPDPDTALPYAREEVLGFVMLFHQRHTPAEEAQMQALTQRLIDAALALGGTYYLPYRPHATRAQFAQAYPQAEAVWRFKQRRDPLGVFQNHFYRNYGPVPPPP